MACVLAALAFGFASSCAATELKLSHFMAPSHPMDAQLMRPFAEELEKATGQSLRVRIFPAG
jgi:TRAP-type C4-dicarboxylate transport system substrate-binding protein